MSDETRVTSRRMTEVIPHVLATILKAYQQRSDLILAAWPTFIGVELAAMTQAVSFSDGLLVVRVKNSTLLSLVKQENLRLRHLLRERFPCVENISFRIG